MNRSRVSSRRTFLKHGTLGAGAILALGGSATAGLGRRVRLDDDWVSIFNGRDLSGWHTNPERIWHGTGGQWEVIDGAIVGRQDPPGSGNGGILLTDEVYGDFELRLEIKPTWGIDSGLFVRATDAGQGYQMMIDYLNGGSVGFLYGEAIGGFGARSFSLVGETDEEGNLASLSTRPNAQYAENPLPHACSGEEWLEAWRIDDWNEVRVRVEGGRPTLTTWINGLKVMVFDAESFEHPRYDPDEVEQTLGDRGRIALQVHGGADRWPAHAESRWRNLSVRSI